MLEYVMLYAYQVLICIMSVKKICFYIKNLPTCVLLLRGDDFNIKRYHLQSTLEVVLLEIDTLER